MNMSFFRTSIMCFSGLLLLLAIAPLFAQQDVHASLIALADRKPIPAVQMTSETGQTKQLSDYKGKVVLLNFWASECGGCVLEIPSIIDIQAAYQVKSFTVVGISMDITWSQLKDEKQAWDKVKPFIAKKKINYPILMGYESLLKKFDVPALPATLLIDKSGKIAAVYVGIISKDNAEANINKLLLE